MYQVCKDSIITPTSYFYFIIVQKKADLSDMDLDTFTDLRSEMLDKSRFCYKEASSCQSEEEFEEEWLHHYMLGKISEKSAENPDKFLYHYQKVSQFLVTSVLHLSLSLE